jgi:hypothetical protein
VGGQLRPSDPVLLWNFFLTLFTLAIVKSTHKVITLHHLPYRFPHFSTRMPQITIPSIQILLTHFPLKVKCLVRYFLHRSEAHFLFERCE